MGVSVIFRIAGPPGLEPGKSLLESDSLPLAYRPLCTKHLRMCDKLFRYRRIIISYRNTTIIAIFLSLTSIWFLKGLQELIPWDSSYTRPKGGHAFGIVI